ncbi:hypothetical protein GHT07_18170 [Caenimonas koreensis DSM 17982]|uniref:Uncharacterized protein n=1 Tax=Caenimonas koreensis DSM 17982 TaxID=1121255 RepID=A0A844AYT7_9BURK|nr:hypothetical protein [Caenimonas koreensis]MRD49204.1 hypothetical protein [Caenimonas koreensis DSM 17982]
MNTYLNQPGEYNRLMETAKKRASELRGDAVNEFGNAAGAAVRKVLGAAVRLVRSYAAQHRAQRSVEA